MRAFFRDVFAVMLPRSAFTPCPCRYADYAIIAADLLASLMPHY